MSEPPVGTPPSHEKRKRVRLVTVSHIAAFFIGALLVGLLWAWTAGHARKAVPFVYVGTAAPVSSVARRYPAKPFPAADLAFGEQQVRRMVLDRPEMGRYVGPDDAVWRYCVEAFAGGAVGQGVYWDSRDPVGGYDGDHVGPFEGDRGSIRVRGTVATWWPKRELHPCEHLWAVAVFELENIRGTPAFTGLYHRALRGELGRDQWVRENSRLEHKALLRTAKLYETLWKPMAEAKGVPTAPSSWSTDTPASFDEWISQYYDPSYYPWDVWGRYYDEDIVPYLRSVDAWKTQRRSGPTIDTEEAPRSPQASKTE